LRLSLGPAYLTSTGDGPAGRTSLNGGGFGLAVAIGGAVARGLALAGYFRIDGAGGTWNGYANASSGITGPAAVSATSISGTGILGQFGILADFYPVATSGWHAGGSLAVSLWTIGPSDSTQSITGTSTGGSLFGGYDWRIGGKWSLGMMAVLGTMGRSSLQDNNQNDTGYSMTPLFFAFEGSVLFF